MTNYADIAVIPEGAERHEVSLVSYGEGTLSLYAYDCGSGEAVSIALTVEQAEQLAEGARRFVNDQKHPLLRGTMPASRLYDPYTTTVGIP
jgi:hypothetical protein